MLTLHGHVKVLDFGLAKQVDGPGASGAGTTTGLTDPGTRLGTPAYMSPEQVLGSPLDPRSDIFSLGGRGTRHRNERRWSRATTNLAS